MSFMPCIQVQVQADSQANKSGYLHTDQVDRAVDSFHHLAPPSSLSFVIPHNTSIIPRLPGRILQLSDRSPCYTIGSFVSGSSHSPGTGPVPILMLCGTVHAFNNIHPNATIQPSATCLATSQRVANPSANDRVLLQRKSPRPSTNLDHLARMLIHLPRLRRSPQRFTSRASRLAPVEVVFPLGRRVLDKHPLEHMLTLGAAQEIMHVRALPAVAGLWRRTSSRRR